MPLIRFRLFLVISLLSAVAAPPFAAAQENVVPERRLAVTRNMDFPGSDLKPVFETTFGACARICLDDPACKAFTFNTKKNACFPKTGVARKTPFEGAVSATVYKTRPAVLKVQRARLEKLAFLPKPYPIEARTQAENLGRDYLSNEWTAEQLIGASRNAEKAGNTLNAMRFMGAALNLTDSGGDWAAMARLALKVKAKDNAEKRKMKRIATSAAINGYLRGMRKGTRVTALNLLAQGMERRGDGRQAIDALRLAQSIAPRLDTERALERMVSRYGFRVTEHKVDNNAASPRACATFSEALAEAGVDYGDYVQLPAPGMPVEAEGSQLCIGGLRHGEHYTLTLRRGLPAKSGEALSKPVELAIYVRDRDPSAHFVGRGYVLPKAQSASIPIVTVNLSQVDLSIHRVAERGLVRAMRQHYFARPLSWWDEKHIAEAIGEKVWTGTGEVTGDVNREVTTALPIGDAISRFKPGVYVLRARVPGADKYDSTAAAQWFVVTDLGLATMTGGDGLHVFVRSLNSAQPVGGTEVSLVARNNDVLATATTDARGYARFAPGLVRGEGGRSPELVTAANGDDFAFLGLSGAAFDLSDRGVAGRVSPPPIDVFLTTDRGAYRPGETVNLTVLARDVRAEAIAGLPLTAIISRPDGVEYTRRLLPEAGAGGHVMSFDLPNGAQRGTWSVRIHADPKARALVRDKFLVEDLMPERIDFDLAFLEGSLGAGKVPRVKIAARYLFGAAGADLGVENETRLSKAEELPGFKGYRFGRDKARFPTRIAHSTNISKTDADGMATIAPLLPDAKGVSVPLKLDVIVRLREGSGRPVERSVSTVLPPHKTMIGIRPQFDGALPEGGTAAFDVLAVGSDGKQRALQRVGWVLNRVETRYQWYESYGNWHWEPVTTRTRVASGEIALAASAPVSIEAPVDWGTYEFKTETLGGEYTVSSTRFHAGWYAPADTGKTPDTLEVGLDKKSYRSGETARLRLVPRHDGTALITVMSNHLIAMQTASVHKGENMIELPVTDDWGAGAYVSATVIRPMDVAAGHNPARALGLGWAKVDPGSHRLAARFVSPPKAGPRGTMTARLRVEGVREGETAYATIAAVDVGILNLTRFKSPDPDGHYFGQRRLGMELRDVYGRLIDGMAGMPGRIRSGGDGPAAERVQGPPPTEELVAFFSGPLTVGADGEVTASFDLPAFNGTVRLMAVAWSKTGVGRAEQDVLVRDPVVLTASLPRFLAPYDQSRLHLELAHAEGPAGAVAIDVSAHGGLLADTAGLPHSVTLAKGARVGFDVPIIAPASGDPEITVALTTPGGKRLVKTLRVPVRVNDPEVARTSLVALADGDTLTLDSDVFADFVPGTGRATVAVGPVARFDTPGLLAALERYPYGCTEQITSKAMPLLYLGEIADAAGLAGGATARQRVRESIAEVLSNQASNGAFGLWRPGTGDLWLDAYVSDFLSRARAQGFAVPNEAFALAIDNLRNKVNYAKDFEKGGEAIAYALMVLAREGAANIGDLRYYADARADNFATPLALAQLGAALASYGDERRADAMFTRAADWLAGLSDGNGRPLLRFDYGTVLRDTAAVLTLAVESGTHAVLREALAQRLSPVSLRGGYYSTQENMWRLMAAHAMAEDTTADAFLINGRPAQGPLVRVLDAQTGAGGTVEILNRSGRSADTVVTAYGVPAQDEPQGGNGYTLERTYFALDGKPIDPTGLRLNQRMVVVLTVKPSQYSEARLMVNDPLPAGLEIDNPNLLKSGDVRALDWLTLNGDVRHAEFRADRFLAAVDWKANKPFRLAYIARAVSPGVFHHPAASVEDMYRPAFRARTEASRITIAP